MTSMQLRRCSVVLFDPREEVVFDLESLASGGDGLASTLTLLALAPHLENEVPVTTNEVALLAQVSATNWIPRAEVCGRFGDALVDALLEKGLLIADSDQAPVFRERDEALRSAHWRPLAAVSHYSFRWSGVRSGDEARGAGYSTMTELAERLGPPPPHVLAHVDEPLRQSLPEGISTSFDELLARRVTCRNFDVASVLPLTVFSTMLRRVFSAQATLDIQKDNTVIKRTSPSGGGLHPTEAYLLVSRVEGVSPGLYHYHSGGHSLEPLASELALDDLALRCVAAQRYFADAHVLVVMASRFPRNFWKYRNHAKAYRVVTLDVGHLSQTLYLSATDLGLGAFITGAINEVEIEAAFGMDPLVVSPIAVCGFGIRAQERVSTEFDPLGTVWEPGTNRLRDRG
ncbi:putative peptide maturation dehydrogenase [Tahibacter amnicola]|uniref:Peptide maturation dehydrogenase n=1 Tax=Tahibacter amnicola TaxID=2976241 RepID=A0ABY6BEP9_9GAMM|nr:putative peptide maturation dehydrogenase [Tahibacter amnicola]UXI68513.1 putative peptide maturation dehydrogenase [Tahibacter amnicola]